MPVILATRKISTQKKFSFKRKLIFFKYNSRLNKNFTLYAITMSFNLSILPHICDFFYKISLSSDKVWMLWLNLESTSYSCIFSATSRVAKCSKLWLWSYSVPLVLNLLITNPLPKINSLLQYLWKWVIQMTNRWKLVNFLQRDFFGCLTELHYRVVHSLYIVEFRL